MAVPTALTQEEHDAMHSKLIDSESQNPHSFIYTPIHKVVGDYNSEVVAIIGTGNAWDAALLNLLPDNVQGITAVVKNDCNQVRRFVPLLRCLLRVLVLTSATLTYSRTHMTSMARKLFIWGKATNMRHCTPIWSSL